MRNIFKRVKKETTEWVVGYSDTSIGYGARMKTFEDEPTARKYLAELKERNTDPTIEYFMYETK